VRAQHRGLTRLSLTAFIASNAETVFIFVLLVIVANALVINDIWL
jgi:hypothetical protein